MQNRPHLIKSSKTNKELDDLASTKQLLNYNETMTSLPNELLQSSPGKDTSKTNNVTTTEPNNSTYIS